MSLAIVLSAVSLVFSGFSVFTARRSRQISEVNLLNSLREDWKQLHISWQRAHLTVIGPSNYYTSADEPLVAEFNKLMNDLASGGYSHDDARSLAWPWILAIRNVVEFLDIVAGYVLRGQLSPEHAHAVLGPEISRRSRTVRALLGTPARDQRFPGFRPGKFNEPYIQSYDWIGAWMKADEYGGRIERVLCLQDILWAQAARQQDLYSHELKCAAEAKRTTGSGYEYRRRVRRLSRQLGGSRYTSVKLQWHLTNAEVVRYREKSNLFPQRFDVEKQELSRELRPTMRNRLRLTLRRRAQAPTEVPKQLGR